MSKHNYTSLKNKFFAISDKKTGEIIAIFDTVRELAEALERPLISVYGSIWGIMRGTRTGVSFNHKYCNLDIIDEEDEINA